MISKSSTASSLLPRISPLTRSVNKPLWSLVGLTVMLYAPIVASTTARCPRMVAFIARDATRTFPVSLAQYSRTPSCHLSSGSWQCTSYLLIRRASAATSFLVTLRLLSQQRGICFRRYVCSILRAILRLLRAPWSAMRCISAAGRNGSTSQ